MPLRSVLRGEGSPGLLGLMPAYRGGGAARLQPQGGLHLPRQPAPGPRRPPGRRRRSSTARPGARPRSSTARAVTVDPHRRGDGARDAPAGARGRAHAGDPRLGRAGARAPALADARARRSSEVRDLLAERRARARARRRRAPRRSTVAPASSVAASAREALDGADVVVTATNSREPVLERAWLAPGAHVNAIGASIPSSRELDVATIAAAELFVDSPRVGSPTRPASTGWRSPRASIGGRRTSVAELGEVAARRAAGPQRRRRR